MLTIRQNGSKGGDRAFFPGLDLEKGPFFVRVRLARRSESQELLKGLIMIESSIVP